MLGSYFLAKGLGGNLGCQVKSVSRNSVNSPDKLFKNRQLSKRHLYKTVGTIQVMNCFVRIRVVLKKKIFKELRRF